MLDKIFGNTAPSYSTGSFLPQDSENGYGQVSAGSGYDFKSYQYPTNLGEKADPHYMVIYINVDSQSKYAGSTGDLGNVVATEQNRISTSIVDSIVGKAGQKVFDFLGNAGQKVVDYLEDVLDVDLDNPSGVTSNKIIDQAIGATSGTFTKTMKRINRAIILPVPANLGADYGISWEGENLGVGADLFDSMSKTQSQEAMNELGKVAGTILARTGARVGAAVINNPLTQRVFGDKLADGKALADKLTRTAINPRKEQLFKNVGFRKFNFSWTLVPKNDFESLVITNIIQELKFHMHPELSTGGFFYVYPSEFDIKFYFRGVENTFLNKVSTCVLTDLKISYTPNNEFVTYKDGAPESIKLDLSFTELELLTKERIMKGY